jgi:hypothetical protein
MITIRRSDQVADATRTYKILLDGAQIGQIRRGESKQFDAPLGRHTLQLKVDWCASQPLELDLAEEPMTFECGSNADKSSLAAFFKSKDYIWLRAVRP